MTFEKFQATRRESDDLGRDIDDCRWDEEPTASGFIYLDALYIERVADHWPERAKNEGKYHLILENEQWVTDDLASLESKLFRWAKSAGCVED